MKKVLFTATVDSHILQFHLPFLKKFKEKGYEVHVATNGNEEIPYCDVKHIVCFERSPFKLNNLKAIKQLRKICDEEKFDIIHCHTPMGSVVTRLAAKKARKKYHTRVIYTAHGFHFFKGAPLLNWLLFYPVEKWLAKYTDTLILINQEDYDLAKKKFSRRCYDIQYVPGVGIDEAKFNFKMTDKEKHDIRDSLGLKDEDFIMIYPAELSKRKRQLWLINSISNLLQKNKNIHLLLPGKDSLNGKCNELVKSLNLDEQIHLLGYRNDIPKLLKISDIALSSANQEGLPVNIMEAMYIGLPIVASNCRGNRDLVLDNQNGFLVDLDDSDRFAECIKTIYLDHKDKYTKKSKLLIKKYMLNNVLKIFEEIYSIRPYKENYKKCLIICWYGSLPNYFKYWEYSCGQNADYDFMLFTDQKIKTKYKNIKIINMSIKEMNSLLSKKLDLDICIEKPYKFCDFRPAYGIIFDEYLKEYDFWGHCDLDQIFGNISNFVTNNFLNEYDIINKNGHFKLYRNCNYINSLYKKSGSKFNYNNVFSSKENYAFDEFSGINRIIKKNNVKAVYIDSFSDIDVKHKRYLCNYQNNFKYQCYLYSNKKLYKAYFKDGQLFLIEKMYLHFQKKKPMIDCNSTVDKFAIGSSGIVHVGTSNIDLDDIKRINPPQSTLYEKIEVLKYIINKLHSFLSCTFKEKYIWLKQKF